MKKLIKLALVFTLIISTPLLSFADASAHTKNKCKNGKRYRTKAKVNGPNGCAREVLRDNNCSGVVSEAVLYRDMSCVCRGSNWGPTYAEGAYAYARSDGGGQETTSYKYTGCNGWRAGGAPFSSIPGIKASKFEGIVKSELSMKDIEYDYINNKILIKNLKGALTINSEDLKNEYSIFQLSVSIVDPNSTDENELSEKIFFVQVAFKDGQLYVTGEQQWFKESDFEIRHLQFGKTYQLNPSHREIALNKDITEDMIIDVKITSDAGNILDGKSEIEVVDTKLTSTLNISSNNVEIKLKANHNNFGEIEVRNMMGVSVRTIPAVQLEQDVEIVFTIPKDELMNHGRYFTVLYKSQTGEVVTDNFLLLE